MGASAEIYGDGFLRESLEELVAQRGLHGAVTFHGYRPDAKQRAAEAGMFVLSSDYEGMSNALAEAMALGTPVISTDCPVGGSAELISHGASGLLVPVGDAKRLAEAMVQVARDSEFALGLADTAKRSLEKFSPSHIATSWERNALNSASNA